MFVLPFLSMLLLSLTPPLIFAAWFVLFLRLGLSGEIIKQTSWFVDPKADSGARGESWLSLAMGIFILSTMLFISLLSGALMQESESALSLGALVLTFIYSPIPLLLVVEAWLFLLNYFGLHYLLYRLKVSIDQIQCPKTTGMTVFQFLTIVTGLVGFGWWCNLDPARREAIFRFSFILSPATVLLTFGLVFILFFSLNKILAVEENTEHHQQIAKRMVFILLSALILLGLVGGSLSLLIHLNPFRLPSIT